MTPLILLGLASLGFGFSLATLVGALGRSEAGFKGLPRKVFHAGVFLGAVPAQLLLGFWGVVTYGIVIALMVLVGCGQGSGTPIFEALARQDQSGGTRGSILVPLLATALGGLATVLLVGHFAIVGYLVCGLGDAAGEPIGRSWGRHKYRSFPWGPGAHLRSLEGSLGVFFVGAFGGSIALALLGHSLPQFLSVGLLCGAVGALVEGLSGDGTDNFWVQLAPALAAWWTLG